MKLCRLLVLLILVTSGCARTEDSREVVSFWAMGYEGDVVALLIPDFERRHPQIRVEL